MKIKIIMPITQGMFDKKEEETAKRYLSQGTEITCVHLERGPESIEDQYDEAFAVPGVLKEVENAEKEGYDGVLISCFGDPGLKPAREVANIPVVGTAESSMLFASALGQKFSVITIVENVVPLMDDIAKKSGIDKLASIRSIDIPVLALKNEEKMVKSLYDESTKAIETDGAHVIVLGCTGMVDIATKLHKMLKEKRGYDVPVVDPAMISLKFLESLISLGLTQSKLTYMRPPQKERTL